MVMATEGASAGSTYRSIQGIMKKLAEQANGMNVNVVIIVDRTDSHGGDSSYVSTTFVGQAGTNVDKEE